MLYTLRWPSNFVKSSTKVAQAVEVAFNLKDNPKTSDFIIEASLRDFRVAPIKGPQMAFVASPSKVVLPPIVNASFEAIASFEGHLSAV